MVAWPRRPSAPVWSTSAERPSGSRPSPGGAQDRDQHGPRVSDHGSTIAPLVSEAERLGRPPRRGKECHGDTQLLGMPRGHSTFGTGRNAKRTGGHSTFWGMPRGHSTFEERTGGECHGDTQLLRNAQGEECHGGTHRGTLNFFRERTGGHSTFEVFRERTGVNAQGDTQLSRCFCSGPGQPSSTRRTARQNEIEDASGCEIATKRVRGPFENPHGPQFLRTRSAEGRAAPTRHRVGTSRGNPFPQFCWRDQPNSCPRNGRFELSVPGRVPPDGCREKLCVPPAFQRGGRQEDYGQKDGRNLCAERPGGTLNFF